MENIREKQQLGTNIKNARERNGISQRRLALMAGTSRSYLWKIETGTADIGFDVLCRIANALDVPIRELVDF